MGPKRTGKRALGSDPGAADGGGSASDAEPVKKRLRASSQARIQVKSSVDSKAISEKEKKESKKDGKKEGKKDGRKKEGRKQPAGKKERSLEEERKEVQGWIDSMCLSVTGLPRAPVAAASPCGKDGVADREGSARLVGVSPATAGVVLLYDGPELPPRKWHIDRVLAIPDLWQLLVRKLGAIPAYAALSLAARADRLLKLANHPRAAAELDLVAMAAPDSSPLAKLSPSAFAAATGRRSFKSPRSVQAVVQSSGIVACPSDNGKIDHGEAWCRVAQAGSGVKCALNADALSDLAASGRSDAEGRVPLEALRAHLLDRNPGQTRCLFLLPQFWSLVDRAADLAPPPEFAGLCLHLSPTPVPAHRPAAAAAAGDGIDVGLSIRGQQRHCGKLEGYDGLAAQRGRWRSVLVADWLAVVDSDPASPRAPLADPVALNRLLASILDTSSRSTIVAQSTSSSIESGNLPLATQRKPVDEAIPAHGAAASGADDGSKMAAMAEMRVREAREAVGLWLRGVSSSWIKSLIQKLVRYRPIRMGPPGSSWPNAVRAGKMGEEKIAQEEQVGGNDGSVCAEAALLAAMAALAAHRGDFNPTVKRWVRGLEALFKRLAVIIPEDARAAAPEDVTFLLSCAMMARQSREWVPSVAVFQRALRLGLAAMREPRCTHYRTDDGSPVIDLPASAAAAAAMPAARRPTGWPLASALLELAGAMPGDRAMFRHLAAHPPSAGPGAAILSTPVLSARPRMMAFARIVDQHCAPAIGYFFTERAWADLPLPKRAAEPFGPLFRALFDRHCGLNPRRAPLAPITDDFVREAQLAQERYLAALRPAQTNAPAFNWFDSPNHPSNHPATRAATHPERDSSRSVSTRSAEKIADGSRSDPACSAEATVHAGISGSILFAGAGQLRVEGALSHAWLAAGVGTISVRVPAIDGAPAAPAMVTLRLGDPSELVVIRNPSRDAAKAKPLSPEQQGAARAAARQILRKGVRWSPDACADPSWATASAPPHHRKSPIQIQSVPSIQPVQHARQNPASRAQPPQLDPRKSRRQMRQPFSKKKSKKVMQKRQDWRNGCMRSALVRGKHMYHGRLRGTRQWSYPLGRHWRWIAAKASVRRAV
jgi:hypothetical protein